MLHLKNGSTIEKCKLPYCCEINGLEVSCGEYIDEVVLDKKTGKNKTKRRYTCHVTFCGFRDLVKDTKVSSTNSVETTELKKKKRC